MSFFLILSIFLCFSYATGMIPQHKKNIQKNTLPRSRNRSELDILEQNAIQHILRLNFLNHDRYYKQQLKDECSLQKRILLKEASKHDESAVIFCKLNKYRTLLGQDKYDIFLRKLITLLPKFREPLHDKHFFEGFLEKMYGDVEKDRDSFSLEFLIKSEPLEKIYSFESLKPKKDTNDKMSCQKSTVTNRNITRVAQDENDHNSLMAWIDYKARVHVKSELINLVNNYYYQGKSLGYVITKIEEELLEMSKNPYQPLHKQLTSLDIAKEALESFVLYNNYNDFANPYDDHEKAVGKALEFIIEKKASIASHYQN